MLVVKSRRDVQKYVYAHHLIQPFGRFEEYPRPVHGFLHPADKYQEPDSPIQLSQMAESEQPSRGWEWFRDRYKIRSFGIGVEVWPEQAWRSIRKHSKRELNQGFPFWDQEKLETWGVIQARDDAHADGTPAEENSTLSGDDLAGLFDTD